MLKLKHVISLPNFVTQRSGKLQIIPNSDMIRFPVYDHLCHVFSMLIHELNYILFLDYTLTLPK
jgi:hypothetical protein